MAPRISVSQITTLRSSFADDVRRYAEAGLDGIGVWELKLAEGDDPELLELFEASGLESAAAVPAVPSILPLPLLGGPEDPAERIEAYLPLDRTPRPVPPERARLPDRHRRGARPGRRAGDRRRRPADDRAPRPSVSGCGSGSSRTSATAASSGRSPPRSRRRSS